MKNVEMSYRPLGRCGTKVSVFGLGGWTTFGDSITDEGAVREIIQTALDGGINFFDIADVYGKGEAERTMGKVLGDVPRHRLVISTKVYFPMSDEVNDRGLSRKHIVESIDKSLSRIGTDYVDVYFCHRFDEHTPMEETARAMDDLVRQGKVIYWGTSQWSAGHLRQVHRLCDARNLYAPQVEQPHYNLLERWRFEREVRGVLDKLGMGAVVWSPLASGVLTGKYDDGLPPGSRLDRIGWLREDLFTSDRLERVRRCKAIADAAGCSRTQLALAWTVAQPGVSSVILGATSTEQLHENLAALAICLTDQTSDKLHQLFPVRRRE